MSTLVSLMPLFSVLFITFIAIRSMNRSHQNAMHCLKEYGKVSLINDYVRMVHPLVYKEAFQNVEAFLTIQEAQKLTNKTGETKHERTRRNNDPTTPV